MEQVAQKTKEQVIEILNDVSVDGCLDFKFTPEVKEIEDGFLIRYGFHRPDSYINTDTVGIGYGRWMFTPKDTKRSGIVKTAWLCIELIIKHELLEGFKYKGVRIFNPHKTVKQLAHPKELLC